MYAKVRMQSTVKILKPPYTSIYNSSKLFTFSCNIPDLKDGDLVICQTIYGYLVCQFTCYTDEPYVMQGIITQPILCKIDLSDIENRKKTVELFMKE